AFTALACALVLAGCAGDGPPTEEPAGDAAQAPFDAVEATIGEIQGALRSGATTCRGVVGAYLARIEHYDASTGLGAITEVNPRALERADDVDRALAAGEDLGPLFCAPILVKDNFDTHDLPTTGGSAALRGSVPPDDAFMVARLREAGAIVLAKTNMAEWAFSPRQTISSSYGRTANAYDLGRVPAGSSGGTASGVAASFGVAGLGTDTGNSIRGPSSHAALFGIRSTLGLTSRDGVIPLIFDRDVAGPMARTVEDGVRLFDVIAGHDPNDALSVPGRREASYLDRLRVDGLEGARVGVLRAHADLEASDPAVLALFEAALADLERAGATLVDPVAIPNWQTHRTAELSCPTFRYDAARYLESLGDGAPIGDIKEAYDAGDFDPHARDGLEFFLGFPGDVPQGEWEEPCPPFLEHPGRRAFLDDVQRAMDEAGVTALVFPTWAYPPAPIDRGREEYRGDNSQLVAPSTGVPAVTVPMGFVDGLPAGLQILGRRFDDGVLIQYAYAYEQLTRHRRAPSAFPALDP
ncbi:MAG: amidase, partial [Acidobacteriota bacterium]